MTNNDAIKALEIHANRGSCADCPYSKMEMGLCQIKMFRDVLDTINRKDVMIGKLQNEIEKAKSEAIKEFAERLCEGRVYNDPVVIAAKCLLKEMTEEKP